MPGGGTTKQTQETSQRNDPYAASVPLLNTIATGGLNAYNSGVGSQVYGGPRVAGFGGVTQAGQASQIANAGGGQGAVRAGDNYLTGLLRNGGSTADGRAAIQGLLGVDAIDTTGIARAANQIGQASGDIRRVGERLTDGRYALDANGFNSLNRSLAGPTQVAQSLQDAASGKLLGGANPYLDTIVGQSNADALAGVKDSFSASGRYGSGMFSAAAADAVSRNENTLRYQDYDQERDRQAQAAQAIDSGLLARTAARQGLFRDANDTRSQNASQAAVGAGLIGQAAQGRLAGAQALYDARAGNANREIGQQSAALQAAQGDRAAALGSLAQIAGVQAGYQAPGATLANVGAQQDALRQRELAAAQDWFNESQSAPWRQLGLLSGIGMPLAGAGGTSSGTTVETRPTPGVLQQLLGGAAAGVGLLGQTGAFGLPAGASGGWLSGLFR